MSERVPWEKLPTALRDAIEARTGPIAAAEEVPEGLNCSLALALFPQGRAPVFLKGVRTTDTAALAGLRCEERINATVNGVSPAIRHRFAVGEWRCLAFVYVDGRHADLSPGSGDLPAVALTLRRMHDLPAPTCPLPQLADRFTAYLLPGEAEALKGSNLLHTDTNPHNIMIDDHSGNAYIVDWAMPAIGPAWIDAAYTAVRLMECGQSPAAALAWLHGFTPWRYADPRAVEIFVNATCRHWTATVGEHAAKPSNDRFRHLLS